MWASPEDSCSYFERAAAEQRALLVCPRGNRPKSEGGAWGGTFASKRARLTEALDAIARDAGTSAFAAEGTLMGFSSGAKVALDVARAEPGRWPRLLLMSMNLATDAATLKAAGVRRVVFAAGELDGTYAHLRALAAAVDKGGVRARFVSLGKVGHHFAVDMDAVTSDAIRWLEEP